MSGKKGSKGGAEKKGGAPEKQKPANKVKVRHILCEKVKKIKIINKIFLLIFAVSYYS
jgi:cell division protein FtsL